MRNQLNKSPLEALPYCSGIEQLYRARIYSHDAGRSFWDFAVEVSSLLAAGLTSTDLRWLIAKGYAEHASETTGPTHKARRFRPIGPLIFPPRTSMTLTDLGLATITEAFSAGASERSVKQPAVWGSHTSRSSLSKRPSWNGELHELRLGRQVVKRFTRPAKSQELILATFEEDGWPDAIDDPLPFDSAQNPKRRLHYTVYHLNRAQGPRLIHFFVNGGGQTVHWRLASDQRAIGAQAAIDAPLLFR